MATLPAYETTPYLQTLDVEVLESGHEGGHPFAILDNTLFYPEGGGQPCDQGTLGSVAVLRVERKDGAIRHYLEGPLQPGQATAQLDWERRFDHMQQHTAQHLLSALAADRFGWKTTSFHISAELCDVELDTPEISSADRETLGRLVGAAIGKALPITARRVPPEELAGLTVRSRGLPEGYEGDVRLVEIEGIDLSTCAGTHLASTAEIEGLHLLGTEPMRGGTRLYWVAGGRARRWVAKSVDLFEQLRRQVGCSDEELPEVVEKKLSQLKAAQRRVRELEKKAAAVEGAELVTEAGGGLAERHFPGSGAGYLQQVARAFANGASSEGVLLTGEEEGSVFFVLALGSEAAVDLRELGGRVAELLGGRGGGSGQLFQGKGSTLENRAEALAAAREALAG